MTWFSRILYFLQILLFCEVENFNEHLVDNSTTPISYFSVFNSRGITINRLISKTRKIIS